MPALLPEPCTPSDQTFIVTAYPVSYYIWGIYLYTTLAPAELKIHPKPRTVGSELATT
ncbi:hypothetical protein BDV33DRAFT_179956 [Aspergillus novoparasiticus]|uniref:Uncharacterized protein n=1 Tax=Aspergillus novoparasiticus TaxID=986946 RepID=A0A5N6EE76_9EURO|nr:hypothetical protein BDV33DRAFT_179956 [Aspergillus novoparasiticus]